MKTKKNDYGQKRLALNESKNPESSVYLSPYLRYVLSEKSTSVSKKKYKPDSDKIAAIRYIEVSNKNYAADKKIDFPKSRG
ncbi:MAG: hypothetical protein N2747_03160 [Chitinophagaceae bacterium]|nr:hypothetical protein [Chitinophagaceae bacterium]